MMAAWWLRFAWIPPTRRRCAANLAAPHLRHRNSIKPLRLILVQRIVHLLSHCFRGLFNYPLFREATFACQYIAFQSSIFQSLDFRSEARSLALASFQSSSISAREACTGLLP